MTLLDGAGRQTNNRLTGKCLWTEEVRGKQPAHTMTDSSADKFIGGADIQSD
jgi:hypothetical protein